MRGSTRTRGLAGLVVKLAFFAFGSVLCTTVVVASILNSNGAPTRTYRAVLSDASALQSGDPVRIAGVEVGRVQSLAVRQDRAIVTFDVDTSQQVTTRTHADVEYENLFGQRNLTLVGGRGGKPMPQGATIPERRTKPALDLTDLFHGFEPLYQALTPTQVNQLTANIIAVFQGQSGTISTLVHQAAQLTNNLADRKTVIDSVVGNLNQLLSTVASHDRQVGQLVDNFSALADNLAGESPQLSAALANASALTGSLASTIGQVQQPLQSSIADLTGVTQAIADNQGALNSMLTVAPKTLRNLSTALQNGTYVNVYVCSLALHTHAPLAVVPVAMPASVETLLSSVTNIVAALDPSLPGGQVGPLPSGGILLPNGLSGNPKLTTPNCRP